MDYKECYKYLQNYYKEKLVTSGLIYKNDKSATYLLELKSPENPRYCEIVTLIFDGQNFNITTDFTLRTLEEKFDRLYQIVKKSFKMGKEIGA